MQSKLSAPVIAVVLMLCVSMVRAEIVRDLYSASVPVADQGAAALAAGAGKALAEVLVKASGSYDILQIPTIRAALGEARSQVQQYAYQRGDAPEEGLRARYEFDPSYVTGLIVDSGAPIWTANRPEVLVWAVIERAGGREFVNWDTAPADALQLSREFGRRGVPLEFPLFDLEDASVLSPDDAWRLDGRALKAASARYNLQHFVGIRVATLSAGKIVGDWAYFNGTGRMDRSVSSATMESFFQRGVAMVADDMASRYAVAPTLSDGEGVRMVVSGVSAYADYAGVVRWLESLELVERANVERVAGEIVELRLHAQADPVQLAALIELNMRLQPVPSQDLGLQLNYQWQK